MDQCTGLVPADFRPINMKQIKTLSDLYNSPGFQAFQADLLGNDLFIHDPERADRIYKAAEHGCDGSTHAEAIQDWRDYFELIEDSLDPDVVLNIAREIELTEAWHEEHGTLDSQIN